MFTFFFLFKIFTFISYHSLLKLCINYKINFPSTADGNHHDMTVNKYL